ncbi:serine/arginine-rich splicing factor 6-like isoform X1 [Anarhichas minor]|uniref:serine/arginine-rich splicing factor 6-like isoform X1 n=1 Tax=Anarhichas minor TaxID=65739 RepID=UPI003F73F995
MPRIYIGRLSHNVREKDIQRLFSGYGKLMEVDLKNGYGFVEFEDNRDADDAVYELNGKELCGERVIVEHARGPRRDRDGHGGGYRGGGRSSGFSSRNHTGRDKYGPPVRTEYRLIVENLSSRCSWQDLKDLMRQVGEVTYADAHKERTNEGVIEFRSQSDLKRAIDKLDGTDINGRKIRLVEDRSRKRRSYSGSRSRSRSRRRSRSRSRRSSRSRSRSRSPGNKRRRHSRSRSGRKSRSKSGGSKSRSRNRRSRSRSRKSKSRSRSPKSQSPSAGRKSKSRSKSRSKVKSERGSRSRSKEICGDKSPSHSGSPMANGKEEPVAKSPSRSPSPLKDDRRSKSREKRSASRSKSRSRSRSASQD